MAGVDGGAGSDVLALTVLVADVDGLGQLGLLEAATAGGAERVEPVVADVNALRELRLLRLEQRMARGLT